MHTKWLEVKKSKAKMSVRVYYIQWRYMEVYIRKHKTCTYTTVRYGVVHRNYWIRNLA